MTKAFNSVLIFLLAAVAGCQDKPADQPSVAKSTTPPRAAVKLTILVVDDPPLAAGIKLLRGEWAERSGGEILIETWSNDQLLAAKELAADLVIFPSRYVGELVERDWLRPVRDSVLGSEELALSEVFPLIRDSSLRYGDQVYALSLGEPPLMLAGSESSQKPINWESVQQNLARNNPILAQPRAVELLARALSYVQNQGQSARLFDLQTMEPRLANPPFFRAFEELTSLAKSTDSDPAIQYILSWPSASEKDSRESFKYFPLPRASQVYNSLRTTWENNDSRQPFAMLGFAGRSVSVTRSTRNSASAFKLLAWLVSEDIATQISPRSQATLWSRPAQIANANKWSANAESADYVSQLLSTRNYFLLPRIPGVDEYLQALEETVNLALASDLSAEEAMSEAVQRWNALTDRYGRDQQRSAYRRHVGLSD